MSSFQCAVSHTELSWSNSSCSKRISGLSLFKAPSSHKSIILTCIAYSRGWAYHGSVPSLRKYRRRQHSWFQLNYHGSGHGAMASQNVTIWNLFHHHIEEKQQFGAVVASHSASVEPLRKHLKTFVTWRCRLWAQQ